MNKIYISIILLHFFFDVNAQDQLMNGGNFQLYSGAPITLFGNFTNNGTATDLGQPITFSGDVILNSGSTFTAGSSILSVAGNWTNNTGIFSPGTSTITFNGTGSQAINGTAASQAFYNLTIAKTTGTLLSTNGSLATLSVQDLTMTSGKFTVPATLNSNGNLLINAGTLTAGTTINIKGNWIKNGGTFTPTTGTVNFIGTGTHILGGTNANSFYNLTLNTLALTDLVQLSKNVTVTSVLTLTKGVFDLNGQSLSVTSASPGAITRTSGYIRSEKTDNSSKIIWSIGNNLTAHTYPFGSNSGSYIPFILNLTAGNIGNVTVSTYQTVFNNTPYPSSPVSVTNMYGSNGADNSANVVDRFWQIDKDGATGTATLTFTATSAEVGAILLPTAQRYQASTNKWQAPLPGQTSTVTSATVPGVTTFSPWTLSSKAALLPIELVSFNAVYTEPVVSLSWATQSEINSDYFTIERSTDEISFETICQVKAAGESMQTLNYQATDKNPSSGLSYYRLKEVDLDGAASYSDLVAIKISTLADQVSVSPNPVTNGTITIKVQNHPGETLDVSVIDVSGKILLAMKNKLDEAQQSFIVIDKLGNFPKGLYILRISGTSETFNRKIIID